MRARAHTVARPACRHAAAPARSRQRGMSLITSLLFTLAALLLGVSVMSSNVMRERMIGNTRDRELAMQAAEAALRDAELDVSSNIKSNSAFTDGCAAGLCTPPSARATSSPLPVHAAALGFDWANAANVRAYGGYTAITAYPGVAAQPVYVIEKLGTLGVAPGDTLLGPPSARGIAYRITARATGARAGTTVLLQSIYVVR